MTFTLRWFAIFLLCGSPLALMGSSSGFGGLAIILDGLLLAATLADWLLLPHPGAFETERIVEPQLSLGTTNRVKIRIRNGSRFPWQVTIHDEPPEQMSSDFQDTAFNLPPQSRSDIDYTVTPAARGEYSFGDVWLKVTGQLGLVRRQWRVESGAAVKVYPNLAETAKFDILARRGRLAQAGIRSARLMGVGREFESLRDYQPDDDYRRIDWKASARHNKLITRQYEVERSQNIILVVDAGRTMVAEIDGIAKIDHAINAALLLAWVAARSDDRVGLLVFADRVQTWIPPLKGRGQVYRILEALYNTSATLSEPDYQGAFAYLRAHWRRRSLIISFTDLWDPVSSRMTIDQLAGLQPRHLVACATLMDSKVLRATEAPIENAARAYEQAAAIQVLEDRNLATAELKRRGVLVVDSPADKFSAALVSRYLEAKERMLL